MAWLTTGGPATNSCAMSRTITEKCPSTAFGGTDADHAAEQHVHHRHRGELPGIGSAAQVAGQERAAAAGDPRPPGGDVHPSSPQRSTLALACCSGTMAATLPPPEEPSSRRTEGARSSMRQPVEIQALGTDGTVGVAAPRGEVVGAHHRGAALDLAPAAHVVGRGESRDAPVVRRRRRIRRRCPPRGTSRVQQQVDALPAGQLAAAGAGGPHPDRRSRVPSR